MIDPDVILDAETVSYSPEHDTLIVRATVCGKRVSVAVAGSQVPQTFRPREYPAVVGAISADVLGKIENALEFYVLAGDDAAWAMAEEALTALRDERAALKAMRGDKP